MEHAQPGLHILMAQSDGGNLAYEYMYRVGDSVPPLVQFQMQYRREETNAVSERIEELLGSGSSGSARDGRIQLQALGNRLCDLVLPPPLLDRLRASSPHDRLALYLPSTLVGIPWELVWDGNEFLCQRFCLSRRLTGEAGLVDATERRIANSRSGQRALIIFGDTTGLRAEGEKCSLERMLGGLYGPNVWFYADHSAAEAIEELKHDFEVCHFIGHGALHKSGSPGWRFSDGSILTSADIEAVSSRASFPLLIFGNACSSARSYSSQSQESISSLYLAFLKRGVAHYIGSISPIPDSQSRLFSELFYRSLASGSSIGEAIRSARRELCQRSIFPAWACYVHYGDPTHKLATHGASPRPAPITTKPQSSTVRENNQSSGNTSDCFGRDGELEKARRHLGGLNRGHFASLLIFGEAGAGKTTLLSRILADAWNDTKGVVSATAIANQRLGVTEPYSVAKQLVHAILKSSIVLEIEGERITACDWLFREIVASFPDLASVFRPDLAQGRVLYEECCRALNVDADAVLVPPHESHQTDIVVQLVRLFGRLDEAAPLLLAVDNAQWIDDSSASLLAHYAEISVRSRGVIVATYRSEARYSAAGSAARYLADELRRRGALSLSLDFSAKTAEGRKKREGFVRDYLQHTFPRNAFPEEFVKRLAEHTGANGLFLSETLKFALEKEQIVASGSAWLLNAQPDEMALPESISSLIQQRIEELGDELKEMLVCASVEGDHFTAQVLAKVRGIDEDRVLSQLLDSLQKRHQIIEELGEHEVSPDSLVSLFNFRNAAIRHHVYQDLAAPQKRRLHKQVGECLEVLYGESRFEVASQLAAHFRLAREWTKASHYSITAARAAAKIYANREAIRLYRTALELWELLPEKDSISKYTLQFELAEILKRIGQYDEAFDFYRRCLTVGVSICDKEICVEVRTDLAELYRSKKKRDRIEGNFADAEESSGTANDLALQVVRDGESEGMWDNVRRAYVVLGTLRASEANFASAEQFYTRATELAVKYDLDRRSVNTMGEILRFAGRLDDAAECYEQFLNWTLRTGAVGEEIIARLNLGLVFLARHEYEDARDSFNTVLEMNSTKRHGSVSVDAAAGIGVSFEMQGATETAEEKYREALRHARIDSGVRDPMSLRLELGKVLFKFGERQLAMNLFSFCPEGILRSDGEAPAMLRECASISRR